MPNFRSFSDINVVQSDGTGHKILVSGNCNNVVLTANSIFFIKDYSTLFSMDYDGSHLIPRYQDLNWFHCTLSDDGSKILLTSHSPISPIAGYNLFTIEPDGTNLQQLTSNEGEFALARLSPRLDEILFQRNSAIAVANLDGTNVRFVTAQTDSTWDGSARYLDENRILYWHVNHKDGSETTRLFDRINQTDKLISSSFGLFSPYTGKIVEADSFICTNDGFVSYYIYTRDTLIRVARGYDATFSADGKKIVYDDYTNIFVEDVDRTNINLVYTEQEQGKNITLPQLSPDGKFIVFQTNYSIPTD